MAVLLFRVPDELFEDAIKSLLAGGIELVEPLFFYK